MIPPDHNTWLLDGYSGYRAAAAQAVARCNRAVTAASSPRAGAELQDARQPEVVALTSHADGDAPDPGKTSPARCGARGGRGRRRAWTEWRIQVLRREVGVVGQSRTGASTYGTVIRVQWTTIYIFLALALYAGWQYYQHSLFFSSVPGNG